MNDFTTIVIVIGCLVGIPWLVELIPAKNPKRSRVFTVVGYTFMAFLCGYAFFANNGMLLEDGKINYVGAGICTLLIWFYLWRASVNTGKILARNKKQAKSRKSTLRTQQQTANVIPTKNGAKQNDWFEKYSNLKL